MKHRKHIHAQSEGAPKALRRRIETLEALQDLRRQLNAEWRTADRPRAGDPWWSNLAVSNRYPRSFTVASEGKAINGTAPWRLADHQSEIYRLRAKLARVTNQDPPVSVSFMGLTVVSSSPEDRVWMVFSAPVGDGREKALRAAGFRRKSQECWYHSYRQTPTAMVLAGRFGHKPIPVVANGE